MQEMYRAHNVHSYSIRLVASHFLSAYRSAFLAHARTAGSEDDAADTYFMLLNVLRLISSNTAEGLRNVSRLLLLRECSSDTDDNEIEAVNCRWLKGKSDDGNYELDSSASEILSFVRDPAAIYAAFYPQHKKPITVFSMTNPNTKDAQKNVSLHSSPSTPSSLLEVQTNLNGLTLSFEDAPEIRPNLQRLHREHVRFSTQSQREYTASKLLIDQPFSGNIEQKLPLTQGNEVMITRTAEGIVSVEMDVERASESRSVVSECVNGHCEETDNEKPKMCVRPCVISANHLLHKDSEASDDPTQSLLMLTDMARESGSRVIAAVHGVCVVLCCLVVKISND